MLSVVDVRTDTVPLFTALCLETSSMCNRACVFCPNSQNARPDELMPDALIHKAVDELAGYKYNGRISPYIYNEPMRDPRFFDLMRMFRQKLPRANVMVSTNGDYIKSAATIKAIYEAGVDQLLINVYSAKDGCGDQVKEDRGVAQAEKRMAQLAQYLATAEANAGSVYAKVKVGSRIGKIERKFGVKSDTKKLAQFELQNRSGNIPWFQKSSGEPLAKMCTRPWRVLNVDWKGTGVLCCNDYHSTVNLGNLADLTLSQIWNNELMHRYRLALQEKDRRLPLCSTCDFGGGQYPHMIHPVTFGETDNKLREEINARHKRT